MLSYAHMHANLLFSQTCMQHLEPNNKEMHLPMHVIIYIYIYIYIYMMYEIIAYKVMISMIEGKRGRRSFFCDSIEI